MTSRPDVVGTHASLAAPDFANLFGTELSDIPNDCLQLITKSDFGYRTVGGEDNERLLLSTLKRIESSDLTVAGDRGARERWEKGWAENLRSLTGGATASEALVPKYVRPDKPLRLHQRFVLPTDPQFELNWYSVFTRWLFKKCFKDVDEVYEFGCGSGINIATLAELFPDKSFVGLDWARSSKKIIDSLSEKNGWNVEGRVFNFFKPDKNVRIRKGSAVLTVGALEQTGTKYGAFLEYLLRAKPEICVNIEPICEWYDPENLVDYLAIMFHRRRHYWEGFPGRLEELKRRGKVEIIKTKRSFFGSQFIEGYSQTIWRPTARAN